MDDDLFGIENAPLPPSPPETPQENFLKAFEEAWPGIGWILFLLWLAQLAIHWSEGHAGTDLVVMTVLLLAWWIADMWRYRIRGWQAVLCILLATGALTVALIGWGAGYFRLFAALAWALYWTRFREY